MISNLTLTPLVNAYKVSHTKKQGRKGVQDEGQEGWQTHERRVGITAARPKKMKKVSV
jgi:hypothetical protein